MSELSEETIFGPKIGWKFDFRYRQGITWLKALFGNRKTLGKYSDIKKGQLFTIFGNFLGC